MQTQSGSTGLDQRHQGKLRDRAARIPPQKPAVQRGL